MSDEQTLGDGSPAAVFERPDPEDMREASANAHDPKARTKRKKGDEDLEYEVEFATPFGKLEFEFEPALKKERKDRERKAKAERDGAKKAAHIAARAAVSQRESGGGILAKLLIVVVVLGIIGGAIAVAWWLFARPEEDLDAIPPEFANEPAEPAPQGVLARARHRISSAVRAGRHASLEAQREQREKFERLAHSGE